MLTAHTEPPALWPRPPGAAEPACRLCGARLHRSLLDLGNLALSNRTVALGEDSPTYPLHARMCDDCLLVQVSDIATASDVGPPEPYLSSRSATCVARAGQFATAMMKRLRLGPGSLVIEAGSNDGYLLRHFRDAGIPVLGIELAATAGSIATQNGIATEIAAFTTEIAMEIAVRHGRADLVVANYVLDHAPDLFDFAAGFAGILRPLGVVTIQVPHLLALVQRTQFDAFRHDTYAYLSLPVLERVLRSVGLRVFDAERLPDRGGSLRVHACHAEAPHAARPGLKSARLAETFAELERSDLYTGFKDRVAEARDEVRTFLQIRRGAGRRIAAFGAAARGSTMLNACGIGTDLVDCVADPDPAKHGRFLPGSHIPIVPVEALLDQPPNDILILPWTHAAEVASPLQPLRPRGVQLWAMLPRVGRV
ncbi:MAG TPA: SAM-dependent methyltransferase [Acetobacteraceae bacterium]|jgi:2-polyprenyl-3-methyl-5-hydroxy-6-metoxy-1,4-benzoquinol methylase|nr:SAM-dependent methyltransferase [Acetobacteraceae bacterium]